MTLKTENLGKRYNREWVFRNFNYSFEPGVYAITGPNGSGKSTLLQVLWCQLPASVGTLRYTREQQTVLMEDVYRHLAIATPYLELIEEFTLEETLKFHFSFKKIRDGKSTSELMDLLEMTHARKKAVRQFSSGMKQRLKLGLAFFSDVPMIFLDEPTTNLDKEAVAWYWKNLMPLVAKSVIFIGSNLENEYPAQATRINLLDYK